MTSQHRSSLLAAGQRYKEKVGGELIVLRLIYEAAAKGSPKGWDEIFPDIRISVKEHLNLIREALMGKAPIEPISINCKPALLAGEGVKNG